MRALRRGAALGAVSPQAAWVSERTELRAQCRVRTTTLYERLAALAADGRIAKSQQGYRLTTR
jgi:hypothetical protein